MTLEMVVIKLPLTEFRSVFVKIEEGNLLMEVNPMLGLQNQVHRPPSSPRILMDIVNSGIRRLVDRLYLNRYSVRSVSRRVSVSAN